MDFYVMTLFPEMVEQTLSCSITGRAIDKGIINVKAVNIRDYTTEKHGKTDDYPYGGGAGMVMQVQPVHDCYKAVCSMIESAHESADEVSDKACEAAEPACMAVEPTSEATEQAYETTELTAEAEEHTCEITKPAFGTAQAGDASVQARETDISPNASQRRRPRVLYMSPQGRTFNQSMAEELAKEEELIFLCGHYEGIDERALELLDVEEVSIGDFILTGGELASVMMIDCISRLIPGVLGGAESAEIESFHDNLLEYPQYSRPEDYMGLKVPEVLLSGHHANVDKWRREQSIIRTLNKRPDLIDKAVLNKKEQKFLHELLKEST